nr:hypothetical protein [Tanacetum cinerariifolium]
MNRAIETLAAGMQEMSNTVVDNTLGNMNLGNNRMHDEGTSGGPQSSQFTRMTKIEFPKFGGDNVRGWMYKCEHFFLVDNVVDNLKVDLPEGQLISFYLVGLQTEIKLAVRMCRPQLLSEAYHLSKIQEAAIKANKQRYITPLLPTPKFITNPNTYTPQSSAVVKQLLVPNIPLATKSAFNTPYPKDSCLKRSFKKEELRTCASIMIRRVPHFQTMRVCRHVGKYKIYILIDSGETFTSDVMLVPLGGCEMIPRVQWLATLGNIQWNFSEQRMDFGYKGKTIILRGTQKSSLQWMQGRKIAPPVAELSSLMLCVYPLLEEEFQWSNTAQMAFEELKEAMILAPVLKLPKFEEEFVFETDASGGD